MKALPKITFEKWMKEVDKWIAYAAPDLTHEDLDDCAYRDWYEDGVWARHAAGRALKAAGWKVW